MDNIISLIKLQRKAIAYYSILFPIGIILTLLFFTFFANHKAIYSTITPITGISIFCTSAIFFFLMIFNALRINLLIKKDHYDFHSVTFISSKEVTNKFFSLYFRCLRIFMRKDKPSFQECLYIENGVEKYCYFILTKQRAEFLKSNLSADIEYRDYGIAPKGIISFKNKNADIEIGKHYGYLKQILPTNKDYYLSKHQKNTDTFGEESFAYQEFLNRQKLILFIIPFLLIIISFICGAIISNICFIQFIPRIGGDIFIILLLLWLGLSIFIFLWEYSFYPKVSYVQKDFMENDFLTKQVILIRSSIPIHGGEYFSCSRLHWMLRKKYLIIHQCVYIQAMQQFFKKQNKEEVLYLFLSQDQIKALEVLFKLEFRFDFGGAGTIVEYNGNIPVNAIIGKRSNILKEITPAENYDYTEEQIAAIEKFNTLYP